MSERINYNFEISGSGRRKSPATLTVNYTFSFNNNDEILYEGSKTYTGKIDENGDLENDINFVINETVTKRDAEFVISADYNLSTSKNDVTFSQNSLSISEKEIPVLVWVEFNEYGELKNADLSGLVDGEELFNYTNVGQITNEDGTIQSITFDYNLSSLETGHLMFAYCENLTSFSSDLSSLTDGWYMFYNCSNLTSFTSDLSNLTNGEYMFYGTNLTSFSSDLSSLTYGSGMFDYCENLTSFSSDLSSLIDGSHMFYNCENLTSFSSDLSSLTYGSCMFDYCENLTSFSSKLGSLKGCGNMFYGCKIDTESLRNIAYNINNLAEKGLDRSHAEDWKYEVLGKIKTIPESQRGRIYIYLDSSVTQEVITECGNELNDKGWSVYFNGKLF